MNMKNSLEELLDDSNDPEGKAMFRSSIVFKAQPSLKVKRNKVAVYKHKKKRINPKVCKKVRKRT